MVYRIVILSIIVLATVGASCGNLFVGTVTRDKLNTAYEEENWSLVRGACTGEHKVIYDAVKNEACAMIEKHDREVAVASADTVREVLSYESISGCGVDADVVSGVETEAYESSVVGDWSRSLMGKQDAYKLTIHNAIGGQRRQGDGEKAVSMTLFARYERDYYAFRSEGNHTGCDAYVDATDSYEPSMPHKSKELHDDVKFCAAPDGDGVLHWGMGLGFDIRFSGAGIPETGSDCTYAHFSMSPDPDEGPKYPLRRHEEASYERDKTCEMYAFKSHFIVGGMDEPDMTFKARHVLMKSGTLYYHACGKAFEVPQELRDEARKRIMAVDPEIDGIDMPHAGWEPMTEFYQDHCGYTHTLCMRESRKREATWWPW